MCLTPRLPLVLLAALGAAGLPTPPVRAQVSLTTFGTRLLLVLITAGALFIPLPVLADADLQSFKADAVDPITAGGTQTYTITVINNGPDDAEFVTLFDALPAGTTFLSLSSPAGWTCTTPPVGSGGDVDCSTDLLAAFSAPTFTLQVVFDIGLADGTVVTNEATVSAETPEASPGDETGTASTTVGTPTAADLTVSKSGAPSSLMAGDHLTYTITVVNNGPADAATVTLEDELPAGTTFQSLSSPGGWTCMTPAVGATGIVNCSIVTLAPGSAAFTLVVQVDASATPGTIANTATVSSPTEDSNPENQSATAFNTVEADPTAVSISKSDFPDPVVAGQILTYFLTATNSSGANLGSATVTDTLPADTTFDSFLGPLPPDWTCSTPAVGATGTITCSVSPFPPGDASIAVNVRVNPSLPVGAVLSNQAQLDVTDGTTTTTRTASTTTSVIRTPATKSVSGDFTPGGSVTYTVVLTNLGPGNQADNPGAELIDVLPAELTLVSAMATSGTATATVATRTVTWNGSIAAGTSVTITINATIHAGVAPGTTITNQGTFFHDADGDGTNESTALTDDPTINIRGDEPTSFVVAAAIVAIPTLDTLGLLFLTALLALGGAGLLGWRRV